MRISSESESEIGILIILTCIILLLITLHDPVVDSEIGYDMGVPAPTPTSTPTRISSTPTSATSTPTSATSTPKSTNSGYIWPAPDAKCWTTYPNHNPPGAIDVQAKMGSNVVAMVDGVVKIANNTCPIRSAGVSDSCPPGMGCGNYVQLQHKNDSSSSYYCHLSNPTVKVGDEVKAGQVIGISGSSGKSSGPHLHVHLGYSGNKTLETIFADKKCPARMRSDDEWHRCGN